MGGAAGWLSCDASTYSSSYEPSETLCDNLDNDCDGAVDGMSRSCGFNDEGLCQLGIETCIDGTWVSCEGAVYPTDEICGDDLDNDCDAMVDEGCPSN